MKKRKDIYEQERQRTRVTNSETQRNIKKKQLKNSENIQINAKKSGENKQFE